MTGAGGLVVWRIFRGEGWAGSHCDLRSFGGAAQGSGSSCLRFRHVVFQSGSSAAGTWDHTVCGGRAVFRGRAFQGFACRDMAFRDAAATPGGSALGTAGRRTAVHAVGFGRAGFIGVVAGCAEKTQGTLQK